MHMQSSSAARVNEVINDRSHNVVRTSVAKKPQLVVEPCTLINEVCIYNYTYNTMYNYKSIIIQCYMIDDCGIVAGKVGVLT